MLLGFVLGVGLVIGYNVFAKPYSYQGSLIDPPAQAADFSLESADGSVFRLADQRGQVVVLFFGYTHCPDVCPTTLYDFTQIKERLGPKAEQVKFVMITSDPERDHPDVVENYVSGFDSEFVGLSGSWKSYSRCGTHFGFTGRKRTSMVRVSICLTTRPGFTSSIPVGTCA